MKPTKEDRVRAMKAVEQLAATLGPSLFLWAARKHMAIRAAERAAERIRKEAEQKIARLRKVSR